MHTYGRQLRKPVSTCGNTTGARPLTNTVSSL